MNKAELIKFLEPFSDDLEITFALGTVSNLVLTEFTVNEIEYIPSQVENYGLSAHVVLVSTEKDVSEYNKHTVSFLNKRDHGSAELYGITEP